MTVVSECKEGVGIDVSRVLVVVIGVDGCGGEGCTLHAVYGERQFLEANNAAAWVCWLIIRGRGAAGEKRKEKERKRPSVSLGPYLPLAKGHTH